MKALKVTSALLSAVMCMSMVVAPVMADDTEAPYETEITETEEEKQEPEKEEPAEEEEAETEKEEPSGEEQIPGDEDGKEALDAVASGTCGKNLKWSLDKNYTLTITGKGSMYGFLQDSKTNEVDTPWCQYQSKIKKVVVSKGVTTIGSFAFFNCDSLSSVSLPKGFKIICYKAFSGCDSLKSIALPKSLTRIDDYAFWCSALESVTIPNGVTEIKEGVFDGCAGLKSVSIPSTVKNIARYAFSQTGLTSVSIPSSVKSIGLGAFEDCIFLKTVNLPVSGLTSIGAYAFCYCYALESFNVPLTVTNIDQFAFQDCVNLDSLWLSQVQKDNMNKKACEGCTSLKFVVHYYAIIGEQFNAGPITYIVTNPATGGTSGTVAVYGFNSSEEKIVVPNTVTYSKDNGKTKVTYKVTKITGAVRQYNDTLALKTLVIGSNVAVIMDGAFANCQNLVSVTGGAGLKTIGAGAFLNCDKLKVFTINSKVLSTIGANAFYADKALLTLNIKKTTKLTKGGVKNSLAGSSVKTVKVKKSKVKKFKKFFKKKNSGKSVKVKK